MPPVHNIEANVYKHFQNKARIQPKAKYGINFPCQQAHGIAAKIFVFSSPYELKHGCTTAFLQLKAEKFPNKTLESFERPTSVGPLQAVCYDI